MIQELKNGFIVKGKDANNFAKFLIKTLILPNPNQVSLQNAKKYSLASLKIDFKNIWRNELD